MNQNFSCDQVESRVRSHRVYVSLAQDCCDEERKPLYSSHWTCSLKRDAVLGCSRVQGGGRGDGATEVSEAKSRGRRLRAVRRQPGDDEVDEVRERWAATQKSGAIS